MKELIKTCYNEEEAKHLFFVSDTHFGHENIIKFCNRPFKTTKEMDEALIKNWNDVIGPDDIVFHLGDFAFGGSQLWNDTLQRLNGHKILIIGNHDMKNLRQGYMRWFDAVLPQAQLQIDNRAVYLNHYPFLCYGGSYRGEKGAVWQLFGHVHSGPNSTGLDSDRLKYCFPYQYDVGVDNNDFTPVSWEEIKSIISRQAETYEKSKDSKSHTIPDEAYKQ